MNLDIPKINCFIRREYLYDGDYNYKGQFDPCTIIGISSYINQPLTFHILIKNEYLYSNIPIIALQNINKDLFSLFNYQYDNDVLSYINCPKKEIDIFTLNELANCVQILYYIDKKEFIQVEKYYFSVDFYTDNELLHFVLLFNNQFALVPNHKVNWKGENELADYKKQTANFKINEN